MRVLSVSRSRQICSPLKRMNARTWGARKSISTKGLSLSLPCSVHLCRWSCPSNYQVELITSRSEMLWNLEIWEQTKNHPICHWQANNASGNYQSFFGVESEGWKKRRWFCLVVNQFNGIDQGGKKWMSQTKQTRSWGTEGREPPISTKHPFPLKWIRWFSRGQIWLHWNQ